MTPSSQPGDRASQNHTQLLQLAYQGDGEAIATLMNRYLSRQNITATVTWEDHCLHVRLASAQIPVADPLVTAIHRTIQKLQVPTLKRLKVSCQQLGSQEIAWSYEQSITPNLTEEIDLLQSDPQPPQPPLAAPISLEDWLNQKAQTSLTGQIQPIPAAPEPATLERFLRFACNPSETALLPLSRIRQVLKLQPQSVLNVPDMPAFVVGIYNFHGEMLWMVDLGRQLGFQDSPTEGSRLLSPQPGSPGPQRPGMAIVIQGQGQSLGLIVPQVIDIERHDPAQLHPPTADLFPATLLPFIQGYLVRSSSPVLDVNALIGDRRFQVHAA